MTSALHNDSVAEAMGDFARHPVPNLVEAWNWKAAAVSAILRGSIFLTANLQAGPASAMRAMLAEIVFAAFASGTLGAVTQRLRRARPLWLTMTMIWIAMPAAMLGCEAALHQALGTPHLRAGLTASFSMASISSGFTWYAMRRGALLAGENATNVADDVRSLPRIAVEFASLPIQLLRRSDARRSIDAPVPGPGECGDPSLRSG